MACTVSSQGGGWGCLGLRAHEGMPGMSPQVTHTVPRRPPHRSSWALSFSTLDPDPKGPFTRNCPLKTATFCYQ